IKFQVSNSCLTGRTLLSIVHLPVISQTLPRKLAGYGRLLSGKWEKAQAKAQTWMNSMIFTTSYLFGTKLKKKSWEDTGWERVWRLPMKEGSVGFTFIPCFRLVRKWNQRS